MFGLSNSMGFNMMPLNFIGQRQNGGEIIQVPCQLDLLYLHERLSSAFKDRFIPWIMREEIHFRFENLIKDNLYIIKYDAHFC